MLFVCFGEGGSLSLDVGPVDLLGDMVGKTDFIEGVIVCLNEYCAFVGLSLVVLDDDFSNGCKVHVDYMVVREQVIYW